MLGIVRPLLLHQQHYSGFSDLSQILGQVSSQQHPRQDLRARVPGPQGGRERGRGEDGGPGAGVDRGLRGRAEADHDEQRHGLRRRRGLQGHPSQGERCADSNDSNDSHLI